MFDFWHRLIGRYGRKRVLMLSYLVVVGVFSLVMNFLVWQQLYHSALLYILIPFVISIIITVLRSYDQPKSHWQEFISHILTAISILFSTSILIGEGFICIAFFAPIYLIVVTFSYIASASASKDKRYSYVFPALVIALSLEGTTSSLSLPRHTSVIATRTTTLSVDEVKANFAKPFDLDVDRHWLISIFPMPYHIDAGSLEEGDVHTVYTRYHRWFVANTHEGKSELLIEEVGPNTIKTRVLSDTTYFSTYLSGTGTEITLLPNAEGGTDITLQLNYRRNLDPAWYFHPLQKFGVGQVAKLIIDELMIRGSDRNG